jgi:hypothetical protein
VLFRRRRRDELAAEESWGTSRSKEPSEGSRWRLRRTRAYLWNFNLFLPGNPCQKRDLKKVVAIRIDLSTMPRGSNRLILTRYLPFFKAQEAQESIVCLESPMLLALDTRSRPPRQRLRSDGLIGVGRFRNFPISNGSRDQGPPAQRNSALS